VTPFAALFPLAMAVAQLIEKLRRQAIAASINLAALQRCDSFMAIHPEYQRHAWSHVVINSATASRHWVASLAHEDTCQLILAIGIIPDQEGISH
jgi:hypothetical protein